jgi:ABC-type transporter Mla subunit MlaD
VVLVLQAGGIFAQLVVLSDSNDRIHAQDAKIADLRRDAAPVLDAVRPLAEELRPLVREARALRRPATRTLEDLAAAAEAAPPALRAARVLVGRSLPVVDALRHFLPGASALVPELRALLPELRALLPRAARFLGETERRALLRRAGQAITATLDLEALQRRSLRLQERQLGVLGETLTIQREALVHIRSLDRKTGGQLPADG